jgi:hypothetical protein
MRIARANISLGMLVIALTVCAFSSLAVQAQTALRGQVTDQLGGLIVGATVTLSDDKGVEKTALTKGDGVYLINVPAPGKYTLRINATGFALYQDTEVNISAQRAQTLDVKMTVEVTKENVDITADNNRVNVEPDSNMNGTVLRGSDLDILPDDPDQLAADLRMLAGPAEGPNGSQILVDGLSGGKIPSKASIREVRLNANPYTAEQNNFGFGRIEIFTKPGAEKFHGQTFLNYNDKHLNARNPFAPTGTPFLSRLYGASLSGPLFFKKGAYFLDFQRREIDDTATINATILDSAFNIVPFHDVAAIPQRLTSFSGRFDYQLNKNNTLVARYEYTRSKQRVGFLEFALPSRTYILSDQEHYFRLSETAILSSSVLNETRFQFRRSSVGRNDTNQQPAINVLGAFLGGGAQIGIASRNTDLAELNNTTTWSQNTHTWKAGVRLRFIHINDLAPINFSGTFTFDSIEQFRQVQLKVAGARPSQFSIATGDSQASTSQVEVSGFVLDDWHVRPNLTLSYGLRYETQSNIHNWSDFAPRLSFAWAPGADPKQTPKTVIRGGFGIFYSRFNEDLTLDATRFNGINQQQYLIQNPNFFFTPPTVADLASGSLPQTVRRIAGDATASYIIGTSLSVERQLPSNTTMSLAYIFKRSVHVPISRNINAPLPGTFDPNDASRSVRPFGNVGNIFVYETGGVANDHTLVLTLNSRFNKSLFLYGRVGLSLEKGNSEGAYFFPSNSYDVGEDFGYQNNDRRRFATAAINYKLPWWGIGISTSMFAASANPFNITTGRDNNGDGVFTDRPAFATDLNKPGVIITRFGNFDPNPLPGQPLVPRNFGRGNGIFTMSMRVSKSFKFGTIAGKQQAGNNSKASTSDKRFGLTVYGLGQNVLNHTNLGSAVGVLTSPNFGRATTITNTPRRIEVGVRFEF